jgi:hypothetical protein
MSHSVLTHTPKIAILILKKIKVGLCDHHAVCMSVYPPMGLCVYMYIPISLLGNGWVQTLQWQRTHAIIAKLFDVCFL